MAYPELYTLGEQPMQLSYEEAAAIPRLLGAAALAHAAPRQSGYTVQAAAINTAGNIAAAGNREYGLSRAYVHGEEAVLSKLLSDYPDIPLMGIGLYAEGATPGELIPCPCGNCRDVLLEEANPDLLLVCGNEQIAVMARLSTFLFDGYQRMEEGCIPDDATLQPVISAAFKAHKRAANVYGTETARNKAYGVALADTAGTIFSGSFDTTAGYDAITPGVAAIQAFRNRQESIGTRLSPLQTIVVANEGQKTPDVFYRDRNALTELVEVLQADQDETQPIPIYLVNCDEQGNAINGFTSDTTVWLPYPFTNRSIGAMEAAQTKLQKLQENI